MKLFLDDARSPQDCLTYMHRRIGNKNILYKDTDWVTVINYEEFVDFVTEFYKDITVISFDHDLGYEDCGEPTGYHCAIFSRDFYKENNLPHPEVFIHSMNPVGTERIKNLFYEK